MLDNKILEEIAVNQKWLLRLELANSLRAIDEITEGEYKQVVMHLANEILDDEE